MWGGGGGRSMDLNLYLGPPLSPRRPRNVSLGSGLAPPPEEPLGGGGRMIPASAEPYSPSSALFEAAVPDPPLGRDHRAPPRSFPGGDPVHDYSPRSPSYRTVAVAPYLHYDPVLMGGLLAEDPLVDGGAGAGVGNGDGRGAPSAHVRSSPSYLPLSAIPEDHGDVFSTPYRPTDVGSSGILEEHDESSLRPDFVEPEFRFRRLIELQRRVRDGRASISPRSYGDEPPDYALVGEMMSPGHAANSRKNKVDGEGIGDKGLGGKKEEKNTSAVNFECNICLDMAQEPVVTSCGHLFCWPCLYQWLHLHCTHNECPVCKGEVIESAVTPIYGRGSLTSSWEAKDGDSGLKIPPRPRGRRIESWRQRIRRPISRRFSVGIANTWRRVLGEELHNEEVEASLQDMINSAHRRVVPRLRARRSVRVNSNVESSSSGVPPGNAPPNRQNEENSGSILRDSVNPWPRFSFVGFDGGGGLASITANLPRIFGRSADSGSPSGAPAPSQILDDLILRPSAVPSQTIDQVSASSTMAMIQVDAGTRDMAAEPTSAGTSRPIRRRGRSSNSLDVDGCTLHSRPRDYLKNQLPKYLISLAEAAIFPAPKQMLDLVKKWGMC